MVWSVKVNRGKKKPWEFVWDINRHGFYYITAKNTYRLFIDSTWSKQIWIGRYVSTEFGGSTYVTVEKQIGASSIEFDNGLFVFHRDKLP